MGIKENIDRIRDRIEVAANRVGRQATSIEIVAACKGVKPEFIEEAISCGIKIIGENRVQEARQKYDIIKDRVEWHMIGHLQTNKVKRALEIFSMIQSLDSLRLAQELNKRAKNTIDVLVEVNTSGEPTKYGVRPEELIAFVEQVSRLPHIRVRGLMTIGPLRGDPRPSFRLLRKLKDEIEVKSIENVRMDWLSMGMTDDFEYAIEEGSNMLRIGRGIFGERQ
ncbi:MAG TPA: YggS family pyridoxal phosphate-dependent enzyme [bacterium (Candidatus Stahlbacteria)]|nr:YggS family pyridoxal phosphate-dependent enzyme [Candidatus Stahlbacteria bacterium]